MKPINKNSPAWHDFTATGIGQMRETKDYFYKDFKGGGNVEIRYWKKSNRVSVTKTATKLKPVLINLNGNLPIHLLLGEDAVNEYDDNGIDSLVSKKKQIQFSTHVIHNNDSLFELFETMHGWNDYAVITVEEYNKLI